MGQWVDLLEWTGGADWSNSGINWNEQLEFIPTVGGIQLKPADSVHFPLSAIIDGDYDLEVRFTRQEGNDSIGIHFPIGVHTMRLLLGGGVFSQVAFFDAQRNDISRSATISNGEQHVALIHVRRDGKKANFSIDLDNTKGYLQWEGDYSTLRDTDPSPWMTTMLQRVWLGNRFNPNLVFDRVRIRMLSGTITRDPVTEANRKGDLKNSDIRLVAEKPLAVNAFEGQFAINQVRYHPPLVLERWPRISREFEFCDDYYGAHPPSRLKCPVPAGAKSFSVVGYNCSSGSSKFQVEIDGKQVHSLRTNIDIIRVDLPPKSSRIELVVDICEDRDYDHAYWCYPRFHAVIADRITDQMLDGKPGPLPFTIASGEVGEGSLEHKKPYLKSAPVNFRDAVPCHEFIFAHAPSTIKYAVPEGMTRFTAVGLNALSKSVKYEVWADDKRIYSSPEAGMVSIDAQLPAATKVIELKVVHLDDPFADHSIWCYPRLHRN